MIFFRADYRKRFFNFLSKKQNKVTVKIRTNNIEDKYPPKMVCNAVAASQWR